jgi:hypothetical protein
MVAESATSAIMASPSTASGSTTASNVAMATPHKCAACTNTPKRIGQPLKTCGRCKKIWYCSRNCQRAHWVLHKLLCASLARDSAKDAPDQPFFESISAGEMARKNGVDLAERSQTLPDLSTLRLTADAPFHMTRKTPNDLPVDIIARIIKHIIPDALVIRADNPRGRWQHDWRPTWIPKLRLITKKIKNVAEQVISLNAGLSACDWEDTGNSLQALYRKEFERSTVSSKWGYSRAIDLTNIFPEYLMSHVKHFRLCLNRHVFEYRFDTIDVSRFPNLKELEITAGDPAKTIRAYAQGLCRYKDMQIVKKCGLDKRVKLLKEVLEEVGVLCPKWHRLAAKAQAKGVKEGQKVEIQPAEDAYEYTVAFLAGCREVISARRLFRHYTTDVLGIDRTTIKGWRPDMMIRVNYADEMNGPNAEKVSTSHKIPVSSHSDPGSGLILTSQLLSVADSCDADCHGNYHQQRLWYWFAE